MTNRPTALIYDKLDIYAGAERVLGEMIALYPQADVAVAIDIMKQADRGFLRGKVPITTFAQKLPFVRNHYRQFLLLLMFAMEQLDLSKYKLILSGSASIAKGVITGPDQLHISYVHSPMRYAWDLQHQYLGEAKLERGFSSFLARYMLHRARGWDLRTANGVDHYVANSHFIARRIWKVYRRESTVIHPPVDVDSFELRTNKEPFYLTASRMVPYKKMAAIVEAFKALPERKLVVIGDGPEMKRVKAVAGPNVEILGYQPTSVLADLMQRAKAFVFAAEEDFGITPVEAQACGTPVIAFGRGGALETIQGLDAGKPTGLFFDRQEPDAIAQAVLHFEHNQDRISPIDCWHNAQRFSAPIFREKYASFVERCWQVFDSAPAMATGLDRRLALAEATRDLSESIV
ncbi:MAG TPA: glycosyltransferase [Steroidobacteraceae bacterium]|nr:glycosyltransferase [Steroidobacteraceae bacterium]